MIETKSKYRYNFTDKLKSRTYFINGFTQPKMQEWEISMKKRQRQRGVLVNYILTYFLVFAVPLILFSFMIYRQTVEKFSHQYIAMAETAASGVSENLNRLYDLGAANTAFVRETPCYSTSYISETAGAFVYIDQNMNKLSGINKDFSQLVFYSRQSDLMYTTSIFNREFYFKNRFVSTYLNETTDLSEIIIPDWLPMEQGTLDGMETVFSTIVYPVETVLRSKKKQALSLLFFHLDERQMKNLLSPTTTVPGAHTIVLWNGHPIFADDYDFFTAFLSGKPNGAQKDSITIDKENYALNLSQTQKQISILSFIPQAYMEHLASDMMLPYILALTASGLIGVILIFFSVRHNYRPIIRLLQKVTGEIDTVPEEMNQLNEMDRTYYALDTIIESKKHAEEDNRQIKLNHLLLHLLENSEEYCKRPSFTQRKAELNVKLEEDTYRCIIFTECIDASALMALAGQEASMFGFHAYCANDVDKSTITALLCGESIFDEDIIAFMERLKSLYSLAGASSTVHAAEHITVLYKQAYYSTLHTIRGQSIYLYDSAQNIDVIDILTRFTKESELFSNAISHRDKSRVTVSLNRIIDLTEMIADSSIVPFLLHHVLFSAVKALAAANLPFSQTTELFTLLPKADNRAAVKSWLNALSIHLNQLLESAQTNHKEELITAAEPVKDFQYILLHINTNYMKPDFSIKALADELGMSVSNFSHYFKSRNGTNLSDYINGLRITEAKRLLSSTDLRITDIVPRLGYSHMSSFTKTFKKATGQTPSEYKNSCLHTDEKEL